MIDSVVFDSSVWIQLERQDKKVTRLVQPYIDTNQVCLVDIIVAEVLRGVKTKEDFDTLKEVFSSFTLLRGDWTTVAEAAFLLARKGLWPPLADIYIAVCVNEAEVTLISTDRDFVRIQKVIPIKLMLL